jgi:hypothetical protein
MNPLGDTNKNKDPGSATDFAGSNQGPASELEVNENKGLPPPLIAAIRATAATMAR